MSRGDVDFRGADLPRAYIRGAIARGRLAHAYLLLGPDPSPQREFALELARILFCARPDASGAPCLACGPCRAIAHENHRSVTIYRPQEGKSAIDIAAPPGKPVLATADGVVTQASDIGDGLGRAVSISHGFGMSTRYGHMSKVNVKQGQKVKRGDVVGFVGSTGRSTGYHLHYEVLQDGKQVDPLAFILDGTQTSGP